MSEQEYGVVTLDEQGRARVRYERRFDHPVERVWQAMTDPTDVFEFFKSVDLKPGGQLSIAYGDHIEHYTIIELSPPHIISYRNNSGDPEDDAWIDRWELSEDGDGCRLVFETGAGPDDPAQLRILVGWHVWLDNWEALLAGTATKEALLETWETREKEVATPYVEALRNLYPGWTYERQSGGNAGR